MLVLKRLIEKGFCDNSENICLEPVYMLGPAEKWYVSSSPCQVSGCVACRPLSLFPITVSCTAAWVIFIISLVNIHMKFASKILCCQFITGHEALSPSVGISLVIGFWTGCIFPVMVEMLYHYVSSFVN